MTVYLQSEKHLYGIEKDGDAIPAPPKNLAADPETASGYLVSLITVFTNIVENDHNRAVKANFTIPAWLKELAEKRKSTTPRYFKLLLWTI